MNDQTSKLPIIGGVLAAIGASLCCAGPLVLLLLGVGGAWVANLTLLEPFKPVFIGLTLVFFAWAGWKLYRPQTACKEGQACALPSVQIRRKKIFWVSLIIALVLVTTTWWIPLLPESWFY